MKKSLKCFVSAPHHTDTTILTRILGQKDVTAYDAFGTSIEDTARHTLIAKIRQADFAIVLIIDNSPNVFYELGICEGMGKPAFIITDKEVQAPHFIQNHVYLRASLSDEELISISLSQFVEALRSRKYKRSPKPNRGKSHRTRNKLLRKFIGEIEQLRTSRHPMKVERLVEEILNRLDIQVVPNESKSQGKGVDFAIWDDNLPSAIGNPLFLEVKYGSLTPEGLYEAENQLREYLAESDATASILLYLDTQGKRFSENYSLNPLVLRFDLADFVRDVSRSSFQEAVLAKRKTMVHGASQ